MSRCTENQARLVMLGWYRGVCISSGRVRTVEELRADLAGAPFGKWLLDGIADCAAFVHSIIVEADKRRGVSGVPF